MLRAGLDVAWEEPLDPADPVLSHPAVILTPHIAGTVEGGCACIRCVARAQLVPAATAAVQAVYGELMPGMLLCRRDRDELQKHGRQACC